MAQKYNLKAGVVYHEHAKNVLKRFFDRTDFPATALVYCATATLTLTQTLTLSVQL
jgi:hypothetical protein